MHVSIHLLDPREYDPVGLECALASVLRNARLRGPIFPFLEIAYPQGVTAKYHDSCSNRPGRADPMTVSSETEEAR